MWSQPRHSLFVAWSCLFTSADSKIISGVHFWGLSCWTRLVINFGLPQSFIFCTNPKSDWFEIQLAFCRGNQSNANFWAVLQKIFNPCSMPNSTSLALLCNWWTHQNAKLFSCDFTISWGPAFGQSDILESLIPSVSNKGQVQRKSAAVKSVY